MLPSSARAVFAALSHRNFRLFLTGQFISLCGTWMQTIAQGWLVLHLTNSAFAVGLVTALGSLPILLFSLYGGVIADRVNKRQFILVLQSLMLLEALTLGVLTALDLITVQWVMGLAVFFGLLTAFEVPTRQAFVAEIVDREDLMNAIALGSSAFNLARVIGPALAGASDRDPRPRGLFLRQCGQLSRSDRGPASNAGPPAERGRHGDGLQRAAWRGSRYVFGSRWPRALVIIVTTFSVFGFSFMPLMPVFARDALGLDATGYGVMVASVGLGAAPARSSWRRSAAGCGNHGWCSAPRCSSALLLIAASLAPNFWSGAAALHPRGGDHGAERHRGQHNAADRGPR